MRRYSVAQNGRKWQGFENPGATRSFRKSLVMKGLSALNQRLLGHASATRQNITIGSIAPLANEGMDCRAVYLRPDKSDKFAADLKNACDVGSSMWLSCCVSEWADGLLKTVSAPNPVDDTRMPLRPFLAYDSSEGRLDLIASVARSRRSQAADGWFKRR
jgi:hypothetical protein